MHKIEWGNLSIFADAPYAGARIETLNGTDNMDKGVGDAPYAGARIETVIMFDPALAVMMPLMRGRELKLKICKKW